MASPKFMKRLLIAKANLFCCYVQLGQKTKFQTFVGATKSLVASLALAVQLYFCIYVVKSMFLFSFVFFFYSRLTSSKIPLFTPSLEFCSAAALSH